MSTAILTHTGCERQIQLEKPLHLHQLIMQAVCDTQIEGERLVLQANGSKGTLATCALRPSGIFGPGDLFFFPTMLEKGRAGKLRCIIGSGENMMEFTYVGNVAQAHLQVSAANISLAAGVWPQSQ